MKTQTTLDTNKLISNYRACLENHATNENRK